MSKTARKQTESKAPATHADDPILTPREAGDIIGKSAETMRRYIAVGCLPYVRLPRGDYGIRRSVMDQYLKTITTPTDEYFKQLADQNGGTHKE
jgi:hypothetical protein